MIAWVMWIVTNWIAEQLGIGEKIRLYLQYGNVALFVFLVILDLIMGAVAAWLIFWGFIRTLQREPDDGKSR